MRPTVAASIVAVLLFALVAPAAAHHERATGLEQALQATMHGLEKAQGKAAEAPGQGNRAGSLINLGDKLTGHEGAAAAIGASLIRDNGNGNAYGRGHSSWVHDMLAEGLIPVQVMEQNHGHAVRDMVHAFNELRKNVKDS